MVTHSCFVQANMLFHSYLFLYQEESFQTRDIAVVELLFATGIRVSELCELSCDAVDLKQATIKVFGKGSKERVIQICSVEVLKILRQYQRLFAPSKCFFINRLGNRLSSQSVRLLIKRCREEIGIGKKITPHTLKHHTISI